MAWQGPRGAGRAAAPGAVARAGAGGAVRAAAAASPAAGGRYPPRLGVGAGPEGVVAAGRSPGMARPAPGQKPRPDQPALPSAPAGARAWERSPARLLGPARSVPTCSSRLFAFTCSACLPPPALLCSASLARTCAPHPPTHTCLPSKEPPAEQGVRPGAAGVAAANREARAGEPGRTRASTTLERG